MILTIEQAEDLAARTLAAINADDELRHGLGWHTDDDRERVASDLAGLQDHRPVGPSVCHRCYVVPWPCSDADRYADGLLRTADLYDVKL